MKCPRNPRYVLKRHGLRASSANSVPPIAGTTAKVAPDLVQRDFGETPDRIWAATSPICRLARGWLYLTVVIDLASGRGLADEPGQRTR